MPTNVPSIIPNMDAIIDHCANLTIQENQRYLDRLEKLKQAAMVQAAAQS